MQPSPEDCASSRLIAYAAIQWPDYETPHHARAIARKLEEVERGEVDRLMVFMPPRHGKSMLASENFPAWYLGRNPDHYVIAASYAQDLADDFGRRVRNQIADPLFQAIFPGVSLRGDSKASNRFAVGRETGREGSYFGVGVGGPITGRGAHLLLIDDPIKNRQDAESETLRKRVKEWYTSTAFTRLMPGGKIVIINTRWHEDDLSGWLLREQPGEWDVLDLPAISEAGEALWPERYPIEALERIRQTIGPRDWSALYQQRPAPESGGYFDAAWLRPVETLPPREHLHVYGASDYAVTADGGDYTVHIVAGMDSDGRLYILDLWRRQAAADDWVEAFCDLVLKWKPIGWAEETGQIKAGVGPFLERRMREKRAHVQRVAFPTRGDKAVRAQSIRGRMALDGLYIPKDAPWRADFHAELMSFPVGVHDDQADALGLIGQVLDRMEAAQVTVRPERKPQPQGTVFLPGPPLPQRTPKRIGLR